MEGTPFPAVLRRALEERGMKPYRLALNSRVDAVTICKILKYAKYRRNANEAQVLQLFLGATCDEVRRERVLDLVEQCEADFFRETGRLADAAGMTIQDLAVRASVGEERVEQARSRTRPATDAIRLRLAVTVLCTPDEITIANVFLQAAGFYTMGGGATRRRSA